MHASSSARIFAILRSKNLPISLAKIELSVYSGKHNSFLGSNNGIREEDNETWLNTETKAKEVLQEKLNLSFEPVIERAHRTGTPSRPGAADGINTRLRAIVCRLRDWKQKDEILRAARRMKPRGIFLSEDFVNETMEKRKVQLDKLKEAKRAGKMAYFVLDRLVIKDRRRVESS